MTRTDFRDDLGLEIRNLQVNSSIDVMKNMSKILEATVGYVLSANICSIPLMRLTKAKLKALLNEKTPLVR